MSTVKPGKERIDSIQVFRGIAATAVILHHAFNELSIVRGQDLASRHQIFNTDLGSAGVDLFFIISGFIMVYTTTNASATASRFLLQRSIRIYPLYWICSIVGILIYLSPWLQYYDEFKNHSIEYVKSFFLYPSFGAGSESLLVRPRPLGQGWTLVYEMVFYGVFASALFIRRQQRALIASIGLVSLWLIGRVLPSSVWQSLLSDSVMLEFILGIAVAYFFTTKRIHLSRSTSIALFVLGMSALLVAAFIPGFIAANPRLVIFGLPCCAIAASVVLGPSQREAPRWLMFLGDASYSLYLTHGLTMALFRIGYSRLALIRTLPQPLYYILLLATVFPVGIVTYLCIEKPVTSFLKSRLARTRRSSTPVTHATSRVIS